MRNLFKLAGKTLKRVSVNECNITGSQLSAITNGVIIGLYKCSGMNRSNLLEQQKEALVKQYQSAVTAQQKTLQETLEARLSEAKSEIQSKVVSDFFGKVTRQSEKNVFVSERAKPFNQQEF